LRRRVWRLTTTDGLQELNELLPTRRVLEDQLPTAIHHPSQEGIGLKCPVDGIRLGFPVGLYRILKGGDRPRSDVDSQFG